MLLCCCCRPAVEQFTQRIYGLPSKDFFAHHEGLLATLRQLLVPAQLQDMGRALVGYAQPQLQQWQEQGQVHGDGGGGGGRGSGRVGGGEGDEQPQLQQ
jgi:hypothetical protein